MARAKAKRKKPNRDVWRERCLPVVAWLARPWQAVAVLAMLCSVVLAVFRPAGVWPIKEVTVQGYIENVAVADVVQSARSQFKGFFFTPLQQVQAAVAKLPWVDQVSVRRVWPAALSIEITEHSGVARWGGEGILTRHGELFFPPRPQAGSELLPVLSGPAGRHAEVLTQYDKVAAQLSERGLKIAALRMTRTGTLEISLQGGTRMLMGPWRDELALRRFIRLYDAELFRRMNDVEVVDLRYRNGVAVRWREQSTTARNSVVS